MDSTHRSVHIFQNIFFGAAIFQNVLISTELACMNNALLRRLGMKYIRDFIYEIV